MNKKILLLLPVFLLTNLLPVAQAAADARLSFAGPTSVPLNTTFAVSVRLNTGSNANVTTVTPYFQYDPAYLQIQGPVTIGGSFPETFRNVTNAATGVVEVSTSNRTPQTGSGLTIASFSMKALKIGVTTLSFDANRSTVLLGDADNTPVLGSRIPLTITITAAAGSGGSSGGSNFTSGGNAPLPIGGDDRECQTPQQVVAEPAEGAVRLSWKNFDALADRFEIRYGTAPGQLTTTLQAMGTTSYTVTGLTPGRTYYFALTASGASCTQSRATTETKVVLGGSAPAAPSAPQSAAPASSVKKASPRVTNLHRAAPANTATGPALLPILGVVLMAGLAYRFFQKHYLV